MFFGRSSSAALQYPLRSMFCKVSYTHKAQQKTEMDGDIPSAANLLKLSLILVKHDNSSSSTAFADIL